MQPPTLLADLSQYVDVCYRYFLSLKKVIIKYIYILIVKFLVLKEHHNNLPLFMNTSTQLLLALKVLTQESVANNCSLLPAYFRSHFVGGMAWQGLEYKY